MTNTAQVNRDSGKCAFAERGIAMRLVFDDGVDPMAAAIEVSDGAEIEDVRLLFRTLRTLGWEF